MVGLGVENAQVDIQLGTNPVSPMAVGVGIALELGDSWVDLIL